MALLEGVQAIQEAMRGWRQTLHAQPEIAFEEHTTSAFVAERLQECGITVQRGLAGTGVVGSLQGRFPGERSLGLRADMDALPIQELTGLPYQSRVPGKMHACGHDGHTTMLLGSAQYLARTRQFAGTVHFIFQPAEENEGGGRVMVEEGLFQQFPMEAVFGLHNWPGLPVGQFAVRPGPMMAAFDVFEIVVQGQGAHGAMPHISIDPVVAAAQIIVALQTLVSRNCNPLDASVVSVTMVQGGSTWNVIPDQVLLRGTARSFREEVQDLLENGVRRVATQVAAGLGASATVRYERRYPATINSDRETAWAADAAADVVGEQNVWREPQPSMGSEDFAFMLQQCPGCYIWAGNGSADHGRTLHNPRYDFNDDLLTVGASYWARLVERLLAPTVV